jgi:hypothetical protein
VTFLRRPPVSNAATRYDALFPFFLIMLRSARCQLRSTRTAKITPLRPAHLARGYAAVTDIANFPKAGAKLHGFTVQRVKQVSELELTALHLQHDKTGAEYLHIARDDANNVFSIGFKTNPPDATGVPHILEHTTLCGSERYTMPQYALDETLTPAGTPFEIPSSRCSPARCPTS